MNSKFFFVDKYKIQSLLIVSAVVLATISSCAKPITTSLYMQTKRAMIYLPTGNEESQSTQTLNEQVSYKHKIDTIKNTSQTDTSTTKDGLKSISLKEITVTSSRPKIKISTIRNGHIDIKFLIAVPKVFMNKDWRVVLRPQLFSGDSLIPFKPIILMGANFKKTQDKQYSVFDNVIEKKIVPKTEYDKVFFNKRKHAQVMATLESMYLKDYTDKYKKLKAYTRWYDIIQRRYLYFNAKNIGEYQQMISNQNLTYLYAAYRALLKGQDTTKYYQKMKAFDKAHNLEAYKKTHLRYITWENVPYSFIDIFVSKPRLDSITNRTITEKDSIQVAHFTYNNKAIAFNEEYSKNKSLYRKTFISLAKIKDPKKVIPIKGDSSMVFWYNQEIPVTENLQKKLKLTLLTDVYAVDNSSWNQRGIDTLTFIVTGLNDLADTTLATPYKYNQRYYNDYKAGLARLKVRDYRGALTILRYYPDYNAALCLVALGMNDKAIELLNKVSQTGKSLYLKSIVLVRLNRIDEAQKALIDACNKESFLGYKAEGDPDLKKLLADPSFKKKIDDIANGF